MQQAYLSLMSTKPAAKITVKDICEKAEVNRSTFYLHYSEPNDILKNLEDDTIAEVVEILSAISSTNMNPDDAKNHLITFLRHLERNDELFRALLIDNSDPHFRRKLQTVALEMTKSAFDVEMPAEYSDSTYLYIVSGSIELLSEWIRNRYNLSENTMCEMLFLLCEGSLKNICMQIK